MTPYFHNGIGFKFLEFLSTLARYTGSGFHLQRLIYYLSEFDSKSPPVFGAPKKPSIYSVKGIFWSTFFICCISQV